MLQKTNNEDRGEPFGKASGRTFIINSNPFPLRNWISPKMKSSNDINNVNRPPSEALKGGFPLSDFKLQDRP